MVVHGATSNHEKRCHSGVRLCRQYRCYLCGDGPICSRLFLKGMNLEASFRSRRKWKISPASPTAFTGRARREHEAAGRAIWRRVPARARGGSESLRRRRSRLKLDHGEGIETRTLIVATGASARWLNLPNEQKLIGHGVSSCATCDGFFYRDKEIMVVGGGDSAMEEANFLTRFGREVALVHRSETFRASKIMYERMKSNPKIELITNTVVEDVYDAEKMRDRGEAEERDNRRVNERDDGFFVAIGHIPNTMPFIGQLDLDPDGYILSHGGARTNIEGVFHAGDVQDRTYRQAITASGAGCMAAIEAERFLEAEGE